MRYRPREGRGVWVMEILSKKLSLIAALAVLAAAAPSYAVINPKLQPWHLVKGYVNVVACSVTAIDAKARTAELKLEGVAKGSFAAKAITLKLANDELAEAILSLHKGQKLVA